MIPLRRRRAACILCAIGLAALALANLSETASAQGKNKQPKWKIDPYTKNDPKLIERAGYVSYGPFDFGGVGADAVTTEQIQTSLPYVQIIWIETPHFKIGINLPTYPVPVDLSTRKKLRAELERLAEKIPGINPKARRLDPWLRAHLFAQRAEDVYTEFCDLAGVTDKDFPQDPDDLLLTEDAVYMGFGPYLGMKRKYLLLLFDRSGPFEQYMQGYLGRKSRHGQRWHFKDRSSLIYTVATDCDDGRLKDDTALHGNVAFNLSQNLLDGFRYYSYELPVWMREGLAHWFERRVSPKSNSFDQTEGSPADLRKTWKWEPYTRKLLANGKFAPFVTAYTWRDFGNITFNDHVALWSRMDFMMSLGKDKWRTFLFEVKGRVNPEDWSPDQRDLVGATRQAIKKAYGFSVLQFDDKWAAWVKKNYATQ